MEKSGFEPQPTRQMTRWVIAAVIAAVALMGLFTLLAAVVVLIELPGWVQVGGGVALALGTAAFAWLVASALASRDADRKPDIPRRR